MAITYLKPIFNYLGDDEYRFVNVYQNHRDKYFMARYAERYHADHDPFMISHKPLYRINIIPHPKTKGDIIRKYAKENNIPIVDIKLS